MATVSLAGVNLPLLWCHNFGCTASSALYLGLVFVCALGPAWGITPAATGAAPYIVFASLPYIVSAAHWLWVRSLCVAQSAWSRIVLLIQRIFPRSGHLRPHDAHLISYEAIIHRLCAPIWMAYGVAHGTLGVLFKLKFDIKGNVSAPFDVFICRLQHSVLLCSNAKGTRRRQTSATYTPWPSAGTCAGWRDFTFGVSFTCWKLHDCSVRLHLLACGYDYHDPALARKRFR